MAILSIVARCADAFLCRDHDIFPPPDPWRETKGRSALWVTGNYRVYALFSVITLLIAGPVIECMANKTPPDRQCQYEKAIRNEIIF